MNSTIRLLLLCGIFTLVAGPSAIADDKTVASVVKNHDAMAAKKLIAEMKKQKKDLVILDVRTAREFKEGHLKEAKLLDFRGAGFQTELAKLDRKKAYLIYCASGKRSGKARTAMKKLGFQEIHHLDGGFRAWSAAKLPSTK